MITKYILKPSFIKIGFVSSGNVLNALIGLAFLTAVARTLSIEDFGKYALLTSLLIFISKIMDLGTNSVFVSESITKQKNIFDAFMSLKFILFGFSIPVALSVLLILGFIDIKLIIIFILGLFGYGINLTMFALFQKQKNFVNVVLINTIPASVKGISAVFVFLGLLNLNITQAFGIFAISIYSGAILLIFSKLKVSKFTFSPKESLELFKKSYKAGTSQSIGFGWPAISNTIAKLTTTFSGVGIFSLADKVANIFTLISLAIFTVLLPKNAEAKAKNKIYDVKETISISLGIIILAIIAIAVSETFLTTIFTEKFEGSIGLLNILIFASAITAIHSFMDNYFFIEEKTTILLKITLSKLSIFLVLCVLLIPIYSLKGIAFAQLGAALAALTLTIKTITSKN